MALAQVDLTAAAATLVYDDATLSGSADDWDRGRRSGAMAMWQSLTGIHDDEEALAYAQHLTDQTRPVVAHIPPL